MGEQRMIRGISKISQIAAMLGFSIMLTSPEAHAVGLSVNSLNSSPCKGYLDSSTPEACRNASGNQVANLCYSSKMAQDSANADLTFAILYTVNAGVCATCLVLDQIPTTKAAAQVLAVVCGVNGMALSVGDIATALILSETSKEYMQDAAQGRDQIFTTALGSAVGLGTSVTTFATQVGSFNFQNTGTEIGSKTKSEGNASAVCLPGLLTSGLQAGLKYYNSRTLIDGAREMVKPIPDLNTCDALPDACRASMQCESNPVATPGFDTAVPLAQGVNPEGSLGQGSSYGNLYNASDITVGNLPSTADVLRDAARLRGDANGTITPEHDRAFTAAATMLNNTNGLGTENVAKALISGRTPSEVLAAGFPTSKGFFDGLGRRVPDLVKRTNGGKPPLRTSAADLYATAKKAGGGKAAGGGNALQDMLAGILNQGKGPASGGATAPGTSHLHFGAAEKASKTGDDVLHAGSSRSLFDIVSSRWAAITVRFIREDQAATGANPERALGAESPRAQPALGSTPPPPGAAARRPAGTGR